MNTSLDDNEVFNVYIIGTKNMFNELLFNFLESSTNPHFKCTFISNLSALNIKNLKDKKNLVLCNCTDLHENDSSNACKCHISTIEADCYWTCVNVPLEHGLETAEQAVKNGVKGIFFVNDSLANFMKGIRIVLNGDLWFSRDVLQATLSNLVDKNNLALSGSSDDSHLTRREKEILKHVALGKTNEQIAKNLNISVLTVKTHVSNIYSKIKVPNRIQAIFWATQNYLLLKD